jgi:hypothetical protein
MNIDSTRVGKEKDRRIKIQASEHKYIISRHKNGEGIRAMAREYGVDKRLIQFIIYPERKALNYKLRLARGGSKQYYNKDKWRETMREHRNYKKSLLVKN